MIDLRRSSPVAASRVFCAVVALVAVSGCIRGKLPPREFYRLVPPDVSTARPSGAPPLAGSIYIGAFKTPGIYGGASIVYRVGETTYGAYPNREWAIPLGEMLGSLTEDVMRARGLTSGAITFDPAIARREEYEWRATVRQFDEVDTPTSVSASVVLAAQLVRASDDSVVWSGSADATEMVLESRRMESVVSALSSAAARAVTQLVDEAVASLRSLAAAGARTD